MYRHPFDAISFFFGLLFIGGALSAILVDDPWPFDQGGLWAIMLIVGGLALLIAAIRPGADRRPEAVTDPMQMAGVATDPQLTQARREVDEYVGEAVLPDEASDDVVTAEVVTEETRFAEVDVDEAVTAEVVNAEAGETTPDESHPSGEPEASADKADDAV